MNSKKFAENYVGYEVEFKNNRVGIIFGYCSNYVWTYGKKAGKFTYEYVKQNYNFNIIPILPIDKKEIIDGYLLEHLKHISNAKIVKMITKDEVNYLLDVLEIK